MYHCMFCEPSSSYTRVLCLVCSGQALCDNPACAEEVLAGVTSDVDIKKVLEAANKAGTNDLKGMLAVGRLAARAKHWKSLIPKTTTIVSSEDALKRRLPSLVDLLTKFRGDTRLIAPIQSGDNGQDLLRFCAQVNNKGRCSTVDDAIRIFRSLAQRLRQGNSLYLQKLVRNTEKMVALLDEIDAEGGQANALLLPPSAISDKEANRPSPISPSKPARRTPAKVKRLPKPKPSPIRAGSFRIREVTEEKWGHALAGW